MDVKHMIKYYLILGLQEDDLHFLCILICLNVFYYFRNTKNRNKEFQKPTTDVERHGKVTHYKETVI